MEAVAQYAAVAADAGITPTALALRYEFASCTLLGLHARAWLLPPPRPVVSETGDRRAKPPGASARHGDPTASCAEREDVSCAGGCLGGR
jgi:hypothetical protein